MSVHAEAYYKFIENEKIDKDFVNRAIFKLESEAKSLQSNHFEIYEYPSPATDPVNWILYIRSPRYSYSYVANYHLITQREPKNFPGLELLIQTWYENSKKCGKLAVEYIRFISDSQNMERIRKNGVKSVSREVPEAMPLIASDSDCSLKYSLIIRNRFLEGEKSIFKNPENTITYIEKVLNHKIPNDILEAIEDGVSKNALTSLKYALYYKKDVFPAGEKSISLSGECSLAYAKEIIKGRFELGEDSICERDDLLLAYAISVLGGKLPEKMHKKMSLKTFSNV